MTDSVRLAAQGMYVSARYADLLHPTPDFNADDIIQRVSEHGELEVIG